MPIHVIGGLANPAVPVAARYASRRRRTVEQRQRPCGVRYMRAFKSISRGADEIFMAGNETGMPAGMPVGRAVTLPITVAPLPFAFDHVRSLRAGTRLQVVGEGALTAHLRLDPPIERTQQQVAGRREEHEQRQPVADEARQEQQPARRWPSSGPAASRAPAARHGPGARGRARRWRSRPGAAGGCRRCRRAPAAGWSPARRSSRRP
ncbi:hypothetical protein BAY1663_04214 [Pseudomonas sp. BAY1663]|nr:hypothetical protein BAY1663_04214 [Pseudomonas sp. BAY1663]